MNPSMEGLGTLEESCVTRARSRWRCRKDVIDLATRPTLLMTLLIALFIATPAAAVLIPFQNCLPSTYQSNMAVLQWMPLYFDAVFDTKNPTHNLLITNWGNVSGAFYTGDLPPPTDPYWTNPNDTNGKIPNSDDGIKSTTLASNVKYLSYEPYNDTSNFCDDLVNASCPLGPVFGNV